MKTKISVDILNDESLVLTICDLIGKHNSGKIELDAEMIKAMCKLDKIKYSSTNRHLNFTEFENGLSVTNAIDQKPFIVLTWKEVHELNTISEQEIVNC